MPLTFDVKTTIARPPNEVFAVLVDVPHHVDWAKGAGQIRDVSDNPAKLGTTWTQVSSMAGRKVEAIARVEACDPDRRFAFSTDKPFPARLAFELEPEGEGTVVNVHAEAEPGGFFSIATPLLRKAATDRLTKDVASLKSKLEAKG
jgi:uncharacterized protein YndB with AHSA1/START domain